jgi:Leucine-rich repeat (LRR) protein
LLKLFDDRLLHFPDLALDLRNQIEYLTLKDNAIETLSKERLHGFNALQTLQVEHNRIKRIENGTFQMLPQIMHLNLDNNPIRKVAPHTFNVSSLKKLHLLMIPLHLGHEHLHLFREATALEHLYLSSKSSKKIISRPDVFSQIFQNISTLKTLHIERVTKLLFLPPHSFQGLPRLQKLILDANGLHSLSHEDFEGLESLRYLGLQNNFI